MSLHRKDHLLQSKQIHADKLSSKGELVQHEFSEEVSPQEMAPTWEQLKNNPMKTAPNKLTTIDKAQRKG